MLTEEQAIARRKFLGASEVAAALGLDPYRSAYDLWAIKTGRAEPEPENAAMARGNLLEPVLIEYAEGITGITFGPSAMLVHRGGLLCANPDGLCVHHGAIVEAKSVAHAHPDEWGEDGSGDVPVRIAAQICQQFACAGPAIGTCYVPLIFPGYRRFEFRLYRVARDERAVEIVVEAGERFMRQNVLADVPPADSRPSLELLKRLRREPGLLADVPAEVRDALIATRAARLQAEKDEQEAQRAYLESLGEAEGDTAGAFTYLPVSRREYTVPAGTFRVLRPAPKRARDAAAGPGIEVGAA